MNYSPAFYADTTQVGNVIHVNYRIPLASHIGWLETGYPFFAN